MKLLREALVGVKRIKSKPDEIKKPDDDSDIDLTGSDEQLPDNNDQLDQLPDDEQDGDPDHDSEQEQDQQTGDPAEQNTDSDVPWGSLSFGGQGPGGDQADSADNQADTDGQDESENEDIDAVADKATEDPDRQGLVRNVRGAHLIFKRQMDDGTYEELWIYNVTTLHDEMTIRRAILAGTDIPPNKPTSPDGKQSYKLWSAGNAELLSISGLQN